jgi:hypothetical protein
MLLWLPPPLPPRPPPPPRCAYTGLATKAMPNKAIPITFDIFIVKTPFICFVLLQY